MEDSQEVKTQEQQKKQTYDWLKGYQFVKGQSGNPGGRPKGRKSLKTFAREYLESLPDDEKVEYLKTVDVKTVWEMAEGKAKQDVDLNAQVTMADLIKELENGKSNTETIGQTMAVKPFIQDSGQTQESEGISAEQSPTALQSEQMVEKYNPKE